MQDIMGSTPGFMGIYLAGVFSATLSTVSSVINSVAMVFLEDCIRVHCEVRHKSRKRRLFSQIFTVIFGVVCMEIAYLVSRIGDPVLETGVTNHACMAGTLLGVFSLGMFFPWANETGALFGMFGAMAITLSMFFGLPKAPNTEVPLTCVTNCNISALSNISRIALLKPRPTIIVPTEIPDKLYCVSYIWLSVISSGSCVIIGIIVSYITGFKKPTDLDPRLIVPLLDVMFPFYYLPENIREYFRFGINHENKYEETRKKRRFSASESTVGSHLTPHGTADVYSERSYVRSEIKSARSMKESGSNRSYLGTGTSIVESEV
ncbi:hypothetical protein EGW08_021372 [Elysia chlorotica]|uniref:Sodium/solute symporter n=1 Tax=Elysia chlorotica TaxID=188477 RepID=A0A433SNT3_ELYCH|nr:hypothetical protein EGW08_021372 [Elysia chlorotica]